MPLAPRTLTSALLGLALLAPTASLGAQPSSFRGSRLITAPANGWCSEARAAVGGMGLEGKKIVLKSGANPKNNEFTFWSGEKQEPLSVDLDPAHRVPDPRHRRKRSRADRSELVAARRHALAQGRNGQGCGAEGLEVPRPAGPTGRRARGPAAARSDQDQGARRDVALRSRRGQRSGDRPPEARQPGVLLELRRRGREERRRPLQGAQRGECPTPARLEMCGNGIQDVGEQCDDGDLVDDDGCANDCQETVLPGRSRSRHLRGDPERRARCLRLHQRPLPRPVQRADGRAGRARLRPRAAALLRRQPAGLGAPGPRRRAAHNHDALLHSAPANNQYYEHFAVEGDSKTSLVYQALYKKINCGPDVLEPPIDCELLADTVAGDGMPSGVASGIDPRELEAIDLWLRGGAPLDRVVAGTADAPRLVPPARDPAEDRPAAGSRAKATACSSISSAWNAAEEERERDLLPDLLRLHRRRT